MSRALMNRLVAVLARAALPDEPLLAADDATRKNRPAAGPLVIWTTKGEDGCESAPGVHPALETTIELEATEVIVPTVKPKTEESTSSKGMESKVCLRDEPVPGVTLIVVNPTGSVATVVWALRLGCESAKDVAKAMRGSRCSFMLEVI
jgi:hypothetical protein